MQELKESKLQLITEYLYENVEDCIYLYIDLKKYGVGHPEVTFWFSEKEGKPDTVLMKYYDSFQIFSAASDWNAEETVQLLKKFCVKTISGKASMIKVLCKKVKGYSTAYGIIVREDSYREFKQFEYISKAEPKDADSIAELMCSDEDFGKNYDVNVLAKQLADRMREKIGRSYIFREKGKIVAHSGVFAETDEVAVESGLIVEPEYRNKFYGMIIHEYIKKQLLTEGKKVYGFRIKESMQRCTKVMGETICGYYGKMTRRDTNEG